MRSYIRLARTQAAKTAYFGVTCACAHINYFCAHHAAIASLSGVFGSALLICPAVDTDNPLLRRGHEAVLTFSSNPQLWVESGVLRMNYACLDARVLSNTSAIIIETIEKTMPDGSIIRQRGGETWSGRSPACPADPSAARMEGDPSLVCPRPLLAPSRTTRWMFMCENRRSWMGDREGTAM